MTLDRRLTWKQHIVDKSKQLRDKLKKLCWLTDRRSNLSTQNKITLYKTVIKPVWTYGIQLWGTASNSNIEILQRFQSKTLRSLINAPWYVTNETIHRDLKIPTVTEEIYKSRSRWGARGGCGFSGRRTTPWETPMNLMFSYSRVVVGRRLGHSPMADSVRRTSEKLVGPYLPRPLTSPSCGAPRHRAPASTGVGRERVSGTRIETLVDNLGELLLITTEGKTKQKVVYGAGEGYPSTGAAADCKAGPAASSSSNCGCPGLGRQARGRAHASGEEDTGTGETRRGQEEPDVMNIGPGTSRVGTPRRRGVGRGGVIRRRNAVVFSLSGRCGGARQAVIPQERRAR